MYTFLTWQRLIQLAEVKQKRFKQFYSFPFMKSNKSQRNNKKIVNQRGREGWELKPLSPSPGSTSEWLSHIIYK